MGSQVRDVLGGPVDGPPLVDGGDASAQLLGDGCHERTGRLGGFD